jgi:hypothetical protein
MQSKNSAQQSFRASEIQAQNSDAALLAAQDSMSAAQGSFRRGEINAQNMLDPIEIQAQFRQSERDYRQATDTGAAVRAGDRLERLAGGDKEMMARYASGMGLRNMNSLQVEQAMVANWDMSSADATANTNKFYAADGQRKLDEQRAGNSNGSGGGAQPETPATAAELKQQAQVMSAQADQLAKASAWARSNGLSAAADAYQEAASKAYYDGQKASVQALDMNAQSLRNLSATTASSSFGPGWSYMGANSSGIDVNQRGLLSPDYVTAGTGSLSGIGSLARNTYDGSVYLSGGVAQGNPRSISFMPSLTGTAGWIFGASDAQSTNAFLAGDSNQVFLSIPTPMPVNLFGAITHSYGGAYALELGIANPGKISFGVVPINHSTIFSDPK